MNQIPMSSEPGLPLGDEPLGFGSNPSDDQQIMYHVSPMANHDSIMQRGLDASLNPKGGYIWTGDVGGQYLFGSQASANRAAQRDFTKAHVYSVDVSGLPIQRDSRMPDAYVTQTPISPDRLKWVGRTEWQGEYGDRFDSELTNRLPPMIGKTADLLGPSAYPVPFVYDIPTDKLQNNDSFVGGAGRDMPQSEQSNDIPKDFKALLPKKALQEPDLRPDYLWVWDPQDAKIHIQKEKGDTPADFPLHGDIARHAIHPDRLEGYAQAIAGGWRLSDSDHREITDPHIRKKLRQALSGKHPAPALPNVRYHGNPAA